jgi:transposase
VVTAANINDGMLLEALLDDVPAVLGPSGRRRCRPDAVHADKAYDAHHCRAYLRRRGIRCRIARRGVESSVRLGRHRWKVERALSWLGCWRRLQVRWDRGSGRFFAFVLVACALTCFNRL